MDVVATILLTYKKHWDFYTSYRKDFPKVEPRLNPDILKWLSRNKIRNTPIFDTHQSAICILDAKEAMLFKLTWI